MKRINRILISAILIFILPLSVYGQQSETGNWMMYFGMNRISDEFSIHSEIQYRNHTMLPNNVEQLLLRTGINYHLSNNAFATIGYAYVPSFDFNSVQEKAEIIEHRIWQQFILTNKISRVKFEHRYRIEQRWINTIYKNRLRYRFMLLVPLNTTKIQAGSYFLSLYDEIFLNTEGDIFDRNRIYGALGYQFNDALSAQIGILRQSVNRFSKLYLQFAFIYNPDFRINNN